MTNTAIVELTARLEFAEKNLTAWKSLRKDQSAAVTYSQNELNQTLTRIAHIEEEMAQLKVAIETLRGSESNVEDSK